MTYGEYSQIAIGDRVRVKRSGAIWVCCTRWREDYPEGVIHRFMQARFWDLGCRDWYTGRRLAVGSIERAAVEIL